MRLLITLLLSAILLTVPLSKTQDPNRPLTYKEYAKVVSLGLWGKKEWRCLWELWHRESRWKPTANNPKSTAYGIPQILNLDEDTNGYKQVDLGIKYIVHRYNTPCKALQYHIKRGWY